ncbi:MFS transporter [Actinorhabdospora filicis]|uniref:MFS transporter n=1 Tax=Actinorhabdospora filicis TaxID=1785913 RepID=A0A9W6SJ73_9ACTN|nr:MFS transporter [Actinorhabdospora filicis]GLZ78044.1 MFS transporter [Actinorhabdospora filicis]
MPLPVLSLMLVVFGLTTGEFVIAGILPEVAADLTVSIPAAGLLVTAYAVGMILGGPLVTVATARIPRRPLISGLIAVSVAANAASAVAPGYGVLLATRFAAGFVVATFFAVAIATAVSTAPPGRQASTVAKIALGLNLGIILGTPAGTLIGQHLGWRATFAAVAVLTSAAWALVAWSVPAGPPIATGPVLGELRVLTRRDVRLAIALTVLGNIGVVTVFTFITPLLTEVSGFAAGTVPVLLLVYGAGAVVGNHLGGRLADRALLPSLTWLLTALMATLTLFWALAGHQIAALVLTFATGVLAFAIVPGMQTRVMTAAGRAPALALAVNASGFQLAAAAAAWLGGVVIDGPGVRAIYPVAAALTATGLAVALISRRRERATVDA